MAKNKAGDHKRNARSKAKKKGKKMSSIEVWSFLLSSVFGVLLLAIAGFLISFGDHKTSSIWFGFAGGVFLLLGGALYLQGKASEPLPEIQKPKEEKPKPPPVMENKDSPPPSINITSVNQSGGITAHTVNMAPQPRHLSETQRQKIVQLLKSAPKIAPLAIAYGEADAEQKQFALEVIEVLREAGCELEVSSAVMMVTPYASGLNFEVNQEQPYPAGADWVQKAFNEAGVPSKWFATPDMKKGKIWVVIGTRE